MQSANAYSMARSFALMLIGPPKQGKTVTAMCFPKPYILDCDNNLAGALRYHNHANKPFEFWYDDPNSVDKPEERWQFCMRALRDAVADPRPDTIIVDGLSLMAYYLEKHILANSSKGNAQRDLVVAGEKVMNMSHWGPFKNLMSQLVIAAKSSGKLFVMTCHEKAEENEAGQVIAYTPLISGSLRHNLAGFFTDVWRCETTNGPKGPAYSLRFAPKNLMQIGNSLGIKEPTLVTTNKTRDQIWSKLNSYIQHESKPTPETTSPAQ